ncbi:MAG TPA: F0F1 ATP synthase subunit epsilon [Gammaproteobacteria bacterium]|mgnify:FL=1|jgi:F-type H+-transporting ATPase subunit epsilon|nr:F0F1 ATP synthase subunit epsilon [Gammaproteobacteria bacterium]MBQ09667.1 F0F1 ATP synthase subunit epsilon [Gammaproteobacteria bacterium]HJN00249.1 F0F1 ATP synthase subunit epsilon [Gammaproteobacteria bacterium]|tara:strand:+ start:502 stop:918 length:417 start_codon:yes stop_codon:yes gene_type:complete
MSAIKVEIVSAEVAIFSGEAAMVVAPGKDGDLGIAPKHTPLLTTLRPGEIELHKEGQEKEFIYVTGGILEVQPHMVTILADSATHSDKLDEEAALQAKNQAEEALKGADKKEDLEQAQAQLAEAAARYSAVKKLKGRK